METELHTLYNVLNSYKQALLKILDRIDEQMLQAVNNYINTHTKDSVSKKYKISMEMVEVLQKFVKMLFTSENLAEDLALKLAELERDSEPERERRSSNPFISLGFRNSQVLTTLAGCSQVKEELEDFSDENEPCRESTESETETETLVDEISGDLIFGSSDLLGEGTSGPPQSPTHSFEEVETPLLDLSDSSTVTDAFKTEIDSVFEDTVSIIEDEIFLEPQNDPEPKLETRPKTEDIKVQRVDPTPQKVEEIKKNEPPQAQPKKVTFAATPKVESKEAKATAVEKLLRMPHYDWREEAAKLFENKNLRKNFKWRTASPTLGKSPTKREKAKEKCTIFDILEDELHVSQQCVFCHIESPSEFYIRTDQALFERLETVLNEDLNSLQKYVVNKFKSKPEARAHLGNFCFGFFPDKRKWYRIEILDWKEDEPDMIFVQLIDYGEKMYWNFTNLKSMTEFYSRCPRMAIKCHFAGIYSPNEPHWSQASVQYLTELSELKKNTTFLPIYVHKEGDSFAVDLLKEQGQHSDTLGQMLVHSSYACEVKITQDTSSDEELEEYENINEAIAGYDAQDEARICPFTDASGRCFKGPSCRLEHGQLAKDGVTTDKVLTMSQPLTKITLPPSGETIEILITGYINTCHFYAHILKKRKALYNDDFCALKETMKANNIVQSYEPFKVYPGIGELVVVQDGLEWFRGTCVGYADNDRFEIFLVDFGYKTFKKMKDLRQMKEDFLFVPFQAIECILFDCQEKKEAPRQASQTFFNECMARKIFSGFVVESGEPLRLQIWDSNNMEMSYVVKQYELGEDRVDVQPTPNSILSF